MIVYDKTPGYKWTNGDGNYYDALYAPDDAPVYTLVPNESLPSSWLNPEPLETSYEEFAEIGQILAGYSN